jgi:hypothetical protein
MHVVFDDNYDTRSLLSATLQYTEFKMLICHRIRANKNPTLKNLYSLLADSEKHMLKSDTI